MKREGWDRDTDSDDDVAIKKADHDFIHIYTLISFHHYFCLFPVDYLMFAYPRLLGFQFSLSSLFTLCLGFGDESKTTMK